MISVSFQGKITGGYLIFISGQLFKDKKMPIQHYLQIRQKSEVMPTGDWGQIQLESQIVD